MLLPLALPLTFGRFVDTLKNLGFSVIDTAFLLFICLCFWVLEYWDIL